MSQCCFPGCTRKVATINGYPSKYCCESHQKRDNPRTDRPCWLSDCTRTVNVVNGYPHDFCCYDHGRIYRLNTNGMVPETRRVQTGKCRMQNCGLNVQTLPYVADADRDKDFAQFCCYDHAAAVHSGVTRVCCREGCNKVVGIPTKYEFCCMNCHNLGERDRRRIRRDNGNPLNCPYSLCGKSMDDIELEACPEHLSLFYMERKNIHTSPEAHKQLAKRMLHEFNVGFGTRYLFGVISQHNADESRVRQVLQPKADEIKARSLAAMKAIAPNIEEGEIRILLESVSWDPGCEDLIRHLREMQRLFDVRNAEERAERARATRIQFQIDEENDNEEEAEEKRMLFSALHSFPHVEPDEIDSQISLCRNRKAVFRQLDQMNQEAQKKQDIDRLNSAFHDIGSEKIKRVYENNREIHGPNNAFIHTHKDLFENVSEIGGKRFFDSSDSDSDSEPKSPNRPIFFTDTSEMEDEFQRQRFKEFQNASNLIFYPFDDTSSDSSSSESDYSDDDSDSSDEDNGSSIMFMNKKRKEKYVHKQGSRFVKSHKK